MVKKNPSNPYSEDEGETKQNSPLPISKARVETVNPKDNGGRHTAFVREYGSRSPKLATVLSPAYGDVSLPEEGSDVAIMYGNKDKPWIIGHWYALDRVEGGELDLPDYEEGDRIVSNGTRQELHITNDGKIQLGYQENYDLPPFNMIEITEDQIDISAENGLVLSTIENDIDVFGRDITLDADRDVTIATGGDSVNMTKHTASMYSAGVQTVAADTEETVQFDTEIYDYGGLLDTTNNQMQIQHDGVYEITIRVTINTQSKTQVRLLMYKNGNQWRRIHKKAHDTGLDTITGNFKVPFDAGDTIEARFFNDDGQSADLNGGDIYNDFTIEYVTGQGP